MRVQALGRHRYNYRDSKMANREEGISPQRLNKPKSLSNPQFLFPSCFEIPSMEYIDVVDASNNLIPHLTCSDCCQCDSE